MIVGMFSSGLFRTQCAIPLQAVARIIGAILFFGCLPAPHGFAQVVEPPNVLVILADDQGWGDVSFHGNPNLSTPNLDALARQGAALKNFYVCAVCSPTRAEFLTGRYHTRMGVYSTSTGGERFDAEEQTIANVFQNAGYRTAAFGKWHSGMQYPYHPNARGFQEFYGFCSGHWGNYWAPMLEHNGQIVQGDGFLTDDLTNHAIDYIDQPSEKPFFVYLALNIPHSPMQVPQPYWDRFKDKEVVPDPDPVNAKRQKLDHTRAAYAMCENIDDNVGRVLDHLKERNLDQNTVVVYFSDNGPNGARFNGGMRGQKGSIFEGGLRSFFAIRYPPIIPPGSRIEQVSGAIDLLPTLADLAGIETSSWQKADKPLDGRSLKSLLKTPDSSQINDRILFSHWAGRISARTQSHRMHQSGQLYDLEVDPGEKRDVAAQNPQLVEYLTQEIQRFSESISHKEEQHPRPFTVGHPDATWTQLPARDATFTGEIQRSNRHPNCTYLKDWKDTTSEIHWDVEVLESGRFQVQMYYACPPEDVGSTIELTVGETTARSSISARILQPVESPLIGAEEDRVPREEGYVRRWKPMDLGVIQLSPGHTTMTLRATEVAGAQVAEMRLLMLKKLN